MVRADHKDGSVTIEGSGGVCMKEVAVLIVEMANGAAMLSGADPHKLLEFMLNDIGVTSRFLLDEAIKSGEGAAGFIGQ